MSLFLVGILLYPAALPGEPAAGPNPSRYPRSDLLVEAVELAKPEVARQFRILDARGKHKYLAGHIPGAVWIDQVTWSRAEVNGQGREEWAKRIGALGIDPDTHVVIYDDNSSKDAARLWWLLRYWGIRDVGLLNGGWYAWEANGGPISAVSEKVPPRVPSLSADVARLATKDGLLAALKGSRITIVDARSQGEFCGEEKTAKRNGAIPGAIHLEWLEVLDTKSQRFKSPEELAELFKKDGIALNRPAVTYCQSGGRAAVMAFALELMGTKQVQNYYKSWREWGNADDTPIVKPK
jgi:thiosulfate/3-mercaptopyruvate sulfurtransferase